MKKIKISMLILCVFILFPACSKETEAEKSTEEVPKEMENTYIVNSENEIFTSDFFTGVKQVRAVPFLGKKTVTDKKEILKICKLFAELKFGAKREVSEDKTEMVIGAAWIEFTYEDDSKVTVSLTAKEVTYKEIAYELDNGQGDSAFEQLRQIFGAEE